MGYKIGLQSWVTKLGYKVGLQSWITKLGYKVGLQSWVTKFGYKVGLQSLVIKLGYKVWLRSLITKLGYKVGLQKLLQSWLQEFWSFRLQNLSILFEVVHYLRSLVLSIQLKVVCMRKCVGTRFIIFLWSSVTYSHWMIKLNIQVSDFRICPFRWAWFNIYVLWSRYWIETYLCSLFSSIGLKAVCLCKCVATGLIISVFWRSS